jgi:hypothetical protein
MRSARRSVDNLRKEGDGAKTSVRIPRGTKLIVCIPGCPLRSWTEFLKEPPRATLAIVEAPVVYAVIGKYLEG